MLYYYKVVQTPRRAGLHFRTLKTLRVGGCLNPRFHWTLVALRRYTQKPIPAAADEMRALPNVVSDRPECL
jgi:hypothetical protein